MSSTLSQYRVLAAIAACLIASALLSCSQSANVSTEEKVVNVYNWADYIGETTLADFEEEFGIKVNYDTYDSSGTVDAKLLAGNTGYDIIVHSGFFSARLMPIGLYTQLDKSKLPNWKNLDPDTLADFAQYDPENRTMVPYMWGSAGFSYNVDMIRERMPDAPLDSAALVFDPELAARFADCGITFLDAPTDVIPMALAYAGHDPNTTNPDELQDAEDVLTAVRPYIKYFSSTKLLMDLPNKEVCIAMSWSGDYATAVYRAEQAGVDIDLEYYVPKEGAAIWYDGAFIPVDAPHPETAYVFLNYLLRPDVIADITNFTHYANANLAASSFVDPKVLIDPAIYASQDVRNKLFLRTVLPPKAERIRTRMWTRVKTGI